MSDTVDDIVIDETVILKIKVCTHCNDFVPISRPTCLNCRNREMNIYEIPNVKLVTKVRES